ncbi:MAG: hypothetical protein JSS46_14480 [Proteobacteria bacterium]|nr:hypothetical protein [Pseudomonadota bacterium]
MDRATSEAVTGLADPRSFGASAAGEAPYDAATAEPRPDGELADPVAELHAIAAEGVAAPTWAQEESLRGRAVGALRALIASCDGCALVRAIDGAPSLAIARYLWRALEAADTDPRVAAAGAAATLATTLFALPTVFVAATEAGPSSVPGVLRDRERIAALLREHRAFGACETFTLAGTLATTEAIGLARLPGLLAASQPDIAGADLRVDGPDERVFLRFLAGALLTAPGVDPLGGVDAGTWGTPLARALQQDLATPAVTLLALPLPPKRLATALRSGRVAQREVAAQIYASNAIRKFRARVGEPSAIISAHRAADAPGGGELRVSLSSPFDPREAEGLRVSLYPFEAAADVAAMLVDLLADCRVDDVRIEPGVHEDIDPGTGLRRFFKNDR